MTDFIVLNIQLNIHRRLHPITPSSATGVKNPDIVPLVKQIQDNIKEGRTLQDKFTKLGKPSEF